MKEIILKIHRIDHYETVLINDNGDRFHFDSHTSNGEELGDFLNGCKELQQREETEELAKSIIDSARCPNPNCDNNGTIAVQVSEDDWQPEPCQWCDMKQDYKSKQE